MATQPLSQSGAKYVSSGGVAISSARPVSPAGAYRVAGSLMLGGARPISPAALRLGYGGFARDASTRPISPSLARYGGGTLVSLLNLRVLSQPLAAYVVDRLVRTNASRPLSAGYALLIPEEPPPPADEIPPVVGNFSPAAGTPITKATSIAFDVTDGSGAFRRIFVVAFFSDTGVSEVIHDGDGFRGFYSATPARQAIAAGSRYTALRSGGWPAAPTIQTFAIDLAGNEVSS